MSRELRSLLYTLALAAGVLPAIALAAWSWRAPFEVSDLVLMAFLVAFVALAGRFPIELSRQAPASLSTVPVFAAVLLLHPAEAALVAAAGTLISEAMLRAPAKAIAFNVIVNAAAGVLAGAALFSLRPGGDPLEFTASHLLAAGASGLVLQSTNVLLVVGMVTLRKGLGFWRLWKDTYAFEVVQEAGLLTVGLIAALLYTEAWWSVTLVLVPSVLAYYGFKRNVSEAAEKALLADELEERLNELKELQAQLIQSAKLASVGTLAAGVAHEINNPVFAIIGRAELLLSDSEHHLRSEMARQYARTIRDMGKRIAQIVRQLLDYSRSSAEREPVDVAHAMEAALGLLGLSLSA